MEFSISLCVLCVAVSDLCSGVLEGGVFGSTEIVFKPGPLAGGQYYADTQSAGAICLLGERVLDITVR